MITQEFIYKAAQRAFNDNHPRFPWPKHELEDQSDQFKRAFLQLCVEVNAEYERHIAPIRTSKAGYRDSANKLLNENEQLETKLNSKSNKLAFAWLLIGLMLGGTITWYMNQPEKCMTLETGNVYMGFNGSYVGIKEVNGETKILPLCEGETI